MHFKSSTYHPDQSMECPICTDQIKDPRALPCGHCYCGPQKPCLNKLQNRPGFLACATCRIEHQMLISQIKPLYGIRDVLENHAQEKQKLLGELKKLTKENEMMEKKTVFTPPPCSSENCSNTVDFWCKDCLIAFCDDCLESQHYRHSVSSFIKHLQNQLQQKLGKSTDIQLKHFISNG